MKDGVLPSARFSAALVASLKFGFWVALSDQLMSTPDGRRLDCLALPSWGCTEPKDC